MGIAGSAAAAAAEEDPDVDTTDIPVVEVLVVPFTRTRAYFLSKVIIKLFCVDILNNKSI